MTVKHLTLVLMLVIALSFVVSASDIVVIPPVIKSVIGEGEQTTTTVSVRAIGEGRDVIVEHAPPDTFFAMSEEQLQIRTGEEGIVSVVINERNLSKGIHTGNVIFMEGDNRFAVPVIVEIESRHVLFDVSAEIPLRSLQLTAGESFDAQVRVINLGSAFHTVNVTYVLMDLLGNSVVTQGQELEIERQAEFTQTFSVPSDLAKGEYVFAVVVTQGNSVGTTTTLLTVRTFYEQFIPYIPYVLLGVLVFVGFLWYSRYRLIRSWNKRSYWRRRASKIERNVRKKIRGERKTLGVIVRKEVSKLLYEKELLGKAYKKGYIEKRTYNLSISRIDRTIKALQKKLL